MQVRNNDRTSTVVWVDWKIYLNFSEKRHVHNRMNTITNWHTQNASKAIYIYIYHTTSMGYFLFVCYSAFDVLRRGYAAD